MESCRIPIELCESIMDAVSEHEALQFDWLVGLEWQDTLCACALTCRAWRARAQHLLWISPRLVDTRRVALITAALPTAPRSLTTTLVLSRLDLSSTSELFMHSFPNLRQLSCHRVSFERGPPLQILRMRLPFFDSIPILHMRNCSFRSLRATLDVIWAFPNLSSLRLGMSEWTKLRHGAGNGHLSTICEHRRACRKLTHLALDRNILEQVQLSGNVFGHAVTNLEIGMPSRAAFLSSFLTNSFPALHSIYLWNDLTTMSEDCETPSCLHVIAASRATPGTLKKIVIDEFHHWKTDKCCRDMVRTSGEVGGSQHRLRELLVGLEELTTRLNECRAPERCAAVIHSALSSMGDVLRFEYRTSHSDPWIKYTLPATQ
ncbi:uncharacterized protein TRAVEDRAFT_42755 [Trametes versicolor FP-101664 SS1]|uniref:uncharacterized protein n=1 Tax=Trametes versicolor (strain FP-101664) TaxID=717944 RepID=UPI00046233ED|nr:uncharacterized protein TRAVEDRAFT_42755 [Trametes versicolor FP-101664 SS1]EIW65384.1 hypothetical protein TRAVEDRAFT_42755 [Trametes versicolor FP-101664 SS1]